MNIFTVDFEDWYHLLYKGITPPIGKWKEYSSILEKNTEILLKLLKQYNAQATFFILGWVAEMYPALIKKIADHGHEIASHGYSHRKIDELTPDEFYNDLCKAKEFIFKASGRTPIGYRAPGFSITTKTSWALNIIKNEGYIYDSSILSSNLPYFNLDTKFNSKFNNGLYELPINTNNLFSINILGGIILRIIHKNILMNIVLGNVRNNSLSVLVIHPRELSNQQPRFNMEPIKYIKTYCGLNNGINNIIFLLDRFKWISAEAYIKENLY